MFSLQLSRTIIIAVAALAAAPFALAICPDDQIGLGVTSNGAEIIANDCGVIDSKSGANVCGAYDQGSHVICGGGFPSSVQTPDGNDWGSCTTDSESCGSATVTFCCARA
ncbi:hypothetical protein M0805_004573 [Coniferiporia weirii]|nr:hypothetical protein M0805_004573 [Coniferiporia weirii]